MTVSEPSSLSAHLRSGFLPVPPSLFHLMALGSMSPWRHLTHQGGHRPYYTGHGHTGCRAQHGGHQSKDIPARTGGCLSAKPAGGLLVCAHRGLGRDHRTLSRSSSYVPSPTACAERGNSGRPSRFQQEHKSRHEQLASHLRGSCVPPPVLQQTGTQPACWPRAERPGPGSEGTQPVASLPGTQLMGKRGGNGFFFFFFLTG